MRENVFFTYSSACTEVAVSTVRTRMGWSTKESLTDDDGEPEKKHEGKLGQKWLVMAVRSILGGTRSW